MRLTVLLTFCLLISEAAVRAADYTQELFTILQLVQDRKYSEAIAGYEKFLQQAPKSLQGPVQFEIASLRALLGDKINAFVKCPLAGKRINPPAVVRGVPSAFHR